MNKGEKNMGNTEKRRPKRHRKRRMQRHKRSVLAVSAVVLLLFAVVSANSISLRAKEQDLEQQIKKEKARAEEIEELREYVGTDQYVEDVARDKLGLVHENEIILKEK